MHRVLILGAGKIGALISGLLAESGSYKVYLGDVDGNAADSVVREHNSGNLTAFALDASDGNALLKHLQQHPVDAVISSLPYYCNVTVAEAARKAGAHYFDLTEDVEVTRAVRAIATGAKQAFVPQCGLAPGFISIAAAELITHFDTLRAVKLRVGALPQHPQQRTQVLPDLVDRGTDQRVWQSLPGDCRRTHAGSSPAGGPGRDRNRRHPVRSVQHLRRPGLTRRNAR